MRKELAIMCAAVCLARAAFAVTMASQPWTTNRIAEAEARVADKITAATNAIPAPDFTTGNAQLRATIEATAPAPGDYATVSNRAMSAIQEHQTLWPAVEASTNYTDAVAAEFENGTRTAANANGALQAIEADYARGAGEANSLFDENGTKSYSDIMSDSTNAARAVVREMSLGGIWDAQLEVWWTPVMRNGSLTYQATTNVNLNAEN